LLFPLLAPLFPNDFDYRRSSLDPWGLVALCPREDRVFQDRIGKNQPASSGVTTAISEADRSSLLPIGGMWDAVAGDQLIYATRA